ncbi:hypothetical protein PBPRB0202 [Photobacterium profundum SS9]|uniref:Uncharacterized protein n=1 Tax=Photobacterium profundum (strain SS9) TaxID=298386 RepID=Q6LKN2_PHOPR|nr:hypothetical protein PBPRB0202 [Photobacterium profundum SS9]
MLNDGVNPSKDWIGQLDGKNKLHYPKYGAIELWGLVKDIGNSSSAIIGSACCAIRSGSIYFFMTELKIKHSSNLCIAQGLNLPPHLSAIQVRQKETPQYRNKCSAAPKRLILSISGLE